ncbi:MAG: Protein HemX [Gammaproteobacteria bacterium]|nr:Protein HemX [Gammaproteobacteria bacterium]
MMEESTPNSRTGVQTEPHDQNQNAAAASTRTPGGGKALSVIALGLAIAAASVTGYLWYEIQVEQKLSQNRLLTDIEHSVNTSRVEVTALEKDFNALREQQKELETRIETQVEARLDSLQSAQETLVERSDALSESIEKVYEERDRSLDSWALEEVEQLLRIANHSLRLSGDVATAVAGLELADQRLQKLANPAFLEVRERLANNITELKSLETVDTAGLALRLSGMVAKVGDLPLAQKTERPIGSRSPETKTGGGESNQWFEAGGEFIRDLKQLVRIQNIDEPAKPLLTPEQHYFLFGNLRLMLSGAQIAALHKDTRTFHDNLEQAAKWIREYFDTEHQGVQQILNDIENMRGVGLSPDLPDISGSLTVLQQTKNRMKAR